MNILKLRKIWEQWKG